MNCCPLSAAGGEPEYPQHISPFDARELLLKLPVNTECELVPLDEALDRVLYEDVYAFFPMPPFDKSPFDGYAFRSADTPGVLRTVRRIAAGDPAGAPLQAGQAVRIFTGAPVPPGADAVIKQEDVSLERDRITLYAAVSPNTNVVRAGEDYPAGARLARRGEQLSPAALGVLASQGVYRLRVYKKPRVAIISTGSELFEVGEERGEYGIYNSSYFVISGYLRKLGFQVFPAGTVEDDPEKIRELTETALNDAELVITTGGASVGDYDYARSTAGAVGAEVLFWKCGMKPGGAILASQRGDKLLLSLSGNPAAAVMGLLMVALPYLRALRGEENTIPETIKLPLLRELPKVSSVTRLLRGHMELRKGKAYFAENLGRGNGNMASFENCTLIGVILPTDKALPGETVIDAVRLEGTGL